MPTYEYKCDNCGHEFQNFVKSMNAPAPKCEKCDSKKVTKKFSVFGVSAPSQPQPQSKCGGCANSSCPMAGQMGL